MSTVLAGLAAAQACGKRLGRQPGQRLKPDRLTSTVLTLTVQGRRYRLIGRAVGKSKNSVADIVKRRCANEEAR